MMLKTTVPILAACFALTGGGRAPRAPRKPP
jgi:hypothetical protein